MLTVGETVFVYRGSLQTVFTKLFSFQLRVTDLGLNFYFICTIQTQLQSNTVIIEYNQALYKFDSEKSQKTYLNLYPKHVQ